MAQLVTSLTLGFGSGHNFMVRGNKPHMELHADRVEPAWDSLSLSQIINFTNWQKIFGEI